MSKPLPKFDRHFFDSQNIISVIGDGFIGGKANGLALMRDILFEHIDQKKYNAVEIGIPRMVVLSTDVFDNFMSANNLNSVTFSELNDDQIIRLFLQSDMPVEYLGDLLSLIEQAHVPLAVRSSSMLEDSKNEPLAGVFATKMIPNNQITSNERFQKLIEAVKYVFASTFFKASQDYFAASSHKLAEEKMAVIIQEVVGQKFNHRFYPNISGVIRSHNFYPTEKIKSSDGIVNLALGLGKTVVEGGTTWSYSPKYPNAIPPFSDSADMLENTQTKFWAINMSPILEYDPTRETEYLVEGTLCDAEYDDTLIYITSTYDSASDKFVMGTGSEGPRCLNFRQLLSMNEFGINELIREVLSVCGNALESPVEIEFALNIFKDRNKIRFGFLQVRSMVITDELIELEESELAGDDVFIASDKALGNGTITNIQDIVYVKPDKFEKKDTPKIAQQIDSLNKALVHSCTPYLLIGFGRWGSCDPWLGIPVKWGQIAGARVIVESTLPGINVDFSQASHFFHNLTSFKLSYLSVHHEGQLNIDWQWLAEQTVIHETEFVRHVRTSKPLYIKIDGKKNIGVVKKERTFSS